MSILFVLLMFLLIITISYFRWPSHEVAARPQPSPDPIAAPKMERSFGIAIPQGYCFHPGHTWASKEGFDNARIGLDGFAANFAAAHISSTESASVVMRWCLAKPPEFRV